MSLAITTLALLLAILAMINLFKGSYADQPWDNNYPLPLAYETLRISTDCIEKCMHGRAFNQGLVDYNGNCRCYDTKDRFYYVDFKYDEPNHSIGKSCKNPQMTNVCADRCSKLSGWQSGYCFQMYFCECYNKYEENNIFYLQDFRYPQRIG